MFETSPTMYNLCFYDVGNILVHVWCSSARLLVHCNVEDSYISTSLDEEESSKSDVIYTFVPTNQPGNQIDKEPINRIWLPVNSSCIRYIEISITDQNNNLIDFNGEDITVILEFH